MTSRFRNAVFLFLLGAVLGPLGDSFHVLSHTSDYPQEAFGLYFWRLPFLVPLIMGAAGVVVGLSHPQIDRWLKVASARPGTRSCSLVVFGILAFLGIYAMTAFVPLRSGGSLDVLIAASSLALWAALDRSAEGLLLAAMTAVAGTGAEILLVRVGAFAYLSPKNVFFGVPSWLPWLYVAASVSVGNLGRYLERRNSQVMRKS